MESVFESPGARDHHPPLNQLAERGGLPEQALEMARDQRNVIRRIQGLMALGYLKHKEAWEIALEAANAKQPYLSIVGCQTLIRLNPEEGITILLKKYAAMDAFPSSQAPSTVTSF